MYKIQFINAYSQYQAILVRISPEERWQQEHYYLKKIWKGIYDVDTPLPSPRSPQKKQETERKQIRKRKKTGSNRLDKQKLIRVESNHKQ